MSESSYTIDVNMPTIPRTRRRLEYRSVAGGLSRSLLYLSMPYLLMRCTEVFAFNSLRVHSIPASLLQSQITPYSSPCFSSIQSPPRQSPISQHQFRRQSFELSQSHSDEPAIERGIDPPFSVTLEGDEYSYRDAIQRTLGWVGAAIIFGGGVWSVLGSTAGQEFFAGYLVEQSLSVDNLFVFLLLFEYFKVPLQFQDRVLNWGIYGAVVMRAIMIGIGAAAIHNFHAILLVFASILIYGSGKFFFQDDSDEEEDPSQNAIVKFSRSLFPSTDGFHGSKFFTIENGIRMATPLFICLVAVEISDVVFAVDSIPAVFGVTENPFIVFSSNIFAIMGLRSLYTILSKAATDLKYLEPAVAWVLGFIGVKMVLEYFGYCIPTPVALAVVATALSVGVGASVIAKQKELPELTE